MRKLYVCMMHMCSLRKRSSGKSDFAVSANIAYGEVKLEPKARGGGVYEDPDKLASMGSAAGRLRSVTCLCVHYNKITTTPLMHGSH